MMRCLLRNILVSLILFSIICSCDNSRKQDRPETVSVDSITELPLPSVPSGITTTEDRAAFVARHFGTLGLPIRSACCRYGLHGAEFREFHQCAGSDSPRQDGEAVQSLCKMALGNPDAFSLRRASLKNISTTPTLLCATKICSYCFSRIGSRPIQ